VELFELLDVPPVLGPALGAEQEGCEDDSTVDFHLCFQGYTMFAPQPVLESTEGCTTTDYSSRDVIIHCDCVRQVTSQAAKFAGACEDRITGHDCGSCRLVCGVRVKHHLRLFKTHGQTEPPSRVSKTVEKLLYVWQGVGIVIQGHCQLGGSGESGLALVYLSNWRQAVMYLYEFITSIFTCFCKVCQSCQPPAARRPPIYSWSSQAGQRTINIGYTNSYLLGFPATKTDAARPRNAKSCIAAPETATELR